MPCDLALYAVGYAAAPPAPSGGGDAAAQPGSAGAYAHAGGRVLGEPGLYCAGWAKRGPSGIIGTNVSDARETVAAVVADLADREATAAAVAPTLLDATGVTTWADWRALDAAEVAAGAAAGAPRVKADTVAAMVAASGGAGR